jgi:queuine tRNA-ribosyltransferase
VKGGGFSFQLLKGAEDEGRLGRTSTSHGVFSTPAFMPVGSQGSVKALSPVDLKEIGTEIILCNAYHLYLRPGTEIVKEMGGLHGFMGWDGPILTDSGGFQILSLCALREVDREGVQFRSHLDGSLHVITPEKSIQIQEALKADIMMVLDDCPPYPISFGEAKASVETTTQWARRAKKAKSRDDQALFGIVQGGMYPELRHQSAYELTFEIAKATISMLPADSPRYLMGMGTPEDILAGVRLGVDMFDCVLPTRCARTGILFTSFGRVAIKNTRYSKDKNPVDPQCGCYTCQNFSRAYLRHLFLSRELLSYRLNAIHNLFYYNALIRDIRQALFQDKMDQFVRAFFFQRGNDDGGILEEKGGEILC